jgi:hypothetical protein
MSRRRPIAVLATLAVTAAACGDDDRAAAPAPPPPAAAVPWPASPADSLCPRDGRWRDCHLVDRIQKAGLAFKATGDTLRLPFLSVPGVEYAIGAKTRLVAFFYDDSAAVARDLAPLDTVALRPAGDTIGPWPMAPAPIRSANLLAVLLAETPRQVERIRLAITAGPPQPTRAAP